MFNTKESQIDQRLHNLENHLEMENPVLLEVVRSFRDLDRLAHRLGLLEGHETYATRVAWWPLVSILGTFSSGKSTFINHLLGYPLQLTGNQAVDDKFTVICYSKDETPRTLPGIALDADPRFPFYQISTDIEEVAKGEGRRVDAYLQLKTCASEAQKGKIIIDSPGFDADEQRTSTLRITDHIVDLSDLVLVFFDARHPEPGAMHDTLDHLVTDTINRPDSNKFLYILNQIDTTAREDNPEEVFAAWQRALAQKGLTAGRFYRTYTPEAAIPIEDDNLRRRFEAKREADMQAINQRLQQVEIERDYRIIGVLEKTAKTIEHDLVPRLTEARSSWRRRVLWLDGIVFGLILAGLLAWSIQAGYWQGLSFAPPWLDKITGNNLWLGLVLAGVAGVVGYLHHSIRKLAAQSVVNNLDKDLRSREQRDSLIRAFRKNSGFFNTSLSTVPVGWGMLARRRIARVLTDADRYVQTLNDRFTNPSGEEDPHMNAQGTPVTRVAKTAPADEEQRQPETVA